MSRVTITETTGRINYVDSDWTAEDIAFFRSLDDSGVLLTYAQKMAIYNWGRTLKPGGGVQSRTVTIDNTTAGDTYAIDGAMQSIAVILNGVPLQAGYSFDGGQWTFISLSLNIDDKLTLIWS